MTSATLAAVGSPAADLGNATVVYKLSGSPVAAPTNAGAYAVTADFAETANYFAADQKTGTLTIDKADAVIHVDPYTVTFDGLPHTSQFTAVGVENPNPVSLVALMHVDATTQTNAGTYTDVAWTFDGNGNYNATGGTVTNTIAKATPVITLTVGANPTYDGLAHYVTSATVAGVGSPAADLGNATVVYKLSGSPVAAPTNAGAYAVTADFAETANYFAADQKTGTLTIDKADAVIHVDPYTVTFDGLPHTSQFTAVGVENPNPVSLVALMHVDATTQTNAGTYTDVAWTFDGNGNYNATGGTVTNTIAKATPVITLTVGANPTYDGLAHYVTSATVAGVGSPAADLGNATVVYKLSGSPVAAPTNAGAYAVTADFAETANYFAADQKTGTLTIDKADAVIHVDPYTVTFDGLPHTSQFTAVGVENPNPVSLVALMHVDATTQTNAGTYTDVAWTFDGNGNYNATGGTVTNTIAKATPVITLTVGANPTYDGLAHYVTSATVAGVGSPAADLGNATVVYKLSGSPVAAPTNAGAYAVTADFAETANYFAADQKTGTLTIDKADAVIHVDPYTVTFDGLPHTSQFTAVGVENPNPVSLVALMHVDATTQTNAGTYTDVAWTFDGNGNYNATGGTVTNTIGKATPAITLTVGANPTYDGLAHYVTSATVAGVGSPAADLGNATVVYKLSGSPVAAPTNAGAYAVTADFAETANYFAADQKTGTLTIDKADAVIHVDPYTVTFDGLPHTSQFTAVGVENPNPVSLVALMHVDATTQTNAGTYTDVAWTFDGNGNYNATGGTVTNTIGKATPAITLTVGANPTYDGLAHYVTSATVAGVGSPAADLGNATVVYKLSGSPVAAPTNAGAYAVTADFAETANYFAADQKTGTLTIDKADAVIHVDPYTVTFDGLPHTSQFTAVGVENPNPVSLVALMHVDATTQTNAGTYTDVAWTFDGNGNYNATGGTVTNTIAKATPVITLTVGANPTYDGLAHYVISATVAGVGSPAVDLGNATVVYKLSGSTVAAPTNAGAYAVTADFAETANYFAADQKTGTLTIDKAPSTITVTVANTTYDGNPHGGTANATGAGNLNISLTVTYTGVTPTIYASSTTAPTLAGTYNAAASYPGDANHNASSDSEDFTINKATTTTTLTLSGYQVRFMDQITFTAVIKPLNKATALTGKVVFKIGDIVYGPATGVAVVQIPGATDGSVQAMLDIQLKSSEVASATKYTVSAGFASDNLNYAGSTGTKLLKIDERDANPYQALGFYTGPVFAWTTSETSNTATVTLSTIIKDIFLPKGDLRSAKVTFYFVNNGILSPIPSAKDIPVGLVDLTDGTLGSASAMVQLNIGSANSDCFRIAVGISGSYKNNPNLFIAQKLITVSKPIPGGFIQGGGFMINSNSGGLIKGTDGSETDFQFDVLFNKKATNPQGKVTVDFVSRYKPDGTLDNVEHKYSVKSNAISLLNTTVANTATFTSKANLVEVIEGGTIGIESGINFQLEVTDGSPDKIAITLYRKSGGIWFSSNWAAVTTVKQAIANGEITVGVANKSATIASEIAPVDVTVEPTLRAYPNPFTDRLNIEFSSANDTQAKLEIYSITGSKLETLFDAPVNGGVMYKVEYLPNLVSSQMVLYHLTMDGKTQVGKIVYQEQR